MYAMLLCRLCAHTNYLFNRTMIAAYNRLLFTFLCQSLLFLCILYFLSLFLLMCEQTLGATLERLGIDGRIEAGIFSFIVVYERAG